MKATIRLALAGAVAVSAACGDFTISNADNPSLNALEKNPTPSVINTATQGLIAGMRAGTTANLSTFAHYGREGYYIDVAQTSLTAFDVPLNPDGGAGWGTTYQYVRLANTILTALDQVGSAMTDPQKNGIRGFAKTVEAFLLHGQVRAQDVIGIAVATDRPRSDPLADVVTKAQAFQYIAQRLDEANNDLGSAGTTFSFQLSAGFAGFNTPTTFRQVNRALRARVAIEMGDNAGALVALAASFLNTGSAMDLGPKNSYGTTSGDAVNPFFDPNGFSYVADTMLPREAQLRVGGAVDLRVSNKMVSMGSTYRTHTRVTSNYRWILYATNTAPIPIIKNEELILIRAEARYRTGDTPGALSDINVVRQQSGGLAALGGFATAQEFDDELLYNRRYSLLFEYGHRWVDLRRFGRLLTDLRGPRGPGDMIFDRVPLPRAECDARSNQPAAACSQAPVYRTTS